MISFKEFLIERKYWGKSAAGAIIVELKTKKILFLKRSADEDSEQQEWEITIGGKSDTTDVDALDTVNREIFEEIGLINEISSNMLELFFDTSDNHDPFKYHVFVKTVPTEFKPVLSKEHTDYRWVDIHKDVIPTPLHFGAERLLKHPKSYKKFLE